MKMSHTRPWLLLLLPMWASLWRRGVADNCELQGHRADLDWKYAEKLQPADAFFDIKLCREGLQWVCFISRACEPTLSDSNNELARSDNVTVLEKCHAVLAIQPQTKMKWRVIIQSNNVEEASSLKFIGNCFTQFECKPDGANGATGHIRDDIFKIEKKERYGIYNKSQKKLMCEFTIAAIGDTFPFDGTVKKLDGKIAFAGMVVPKEGLNQKIFPFRVLKDSADMNLKVIEKLNAGCLIEIVFFIPAGDTGEDFKRVNQDRKEFSCPPDYYMRYQKKYTDEEINQGKKSVLQSVRGMTCEPRQLGLDIDNGEGSPQTIQGVKDVHCVKKRCKFCAAPNCDNASKCPKISGNDYKSSTACAKLKCTGKNEFLDVAGQLYAEANCTDDYRWMIDDEIEVKNVTCRSANKPCPEYQNAIKMKNPAKDLFALEKNGDDAAVRCTENAQMSYALDDDKEVLLVEIVCNNGQWYETVNQSGVAVMEPYKNGDLICTALADNTVQPAKGGLLMYAGIGLAVVAVIIAVILLICCCLSKNKKKKNRLSAVKHQLANKDSKSRDSKNVSKGTTSKGTTSKGSSDRSVTGARGKKKKDGEDKEDGPAIPDDGEPKKPEPRSKPATGSSITKTSELQKLQEEEERKKAAAAAALLETSKVEDGGNDKEEPQTDTPIDTAVIGKDTRDLEHPDKTPFSPKKPLQKRRLKKATIFESNDPAPPRTPDTAAAQPPESEPPTPAETPAPAPPSVMAKTQAGGADEDDEKEQPMWHNQPPAPAPAPAPVPATDVTQLELLRTYAAPPPATAAAPASDPQDEMKTSREKERDAAAESDARKKKIIADMPTGKKKESAKKVKSNKLTTPKAELMEPKKVRSSFLKPSDLVSDKSSSKKGGKSKKATKRAADEPSKKMDATQHQHVHGSEAGCGPLCMPMPRSHTDPDEEN